MNILTKSLSENSATMDNDDYIVPKEEENQKQQPGLSMLGEAWLRRIVNSGVIGGSESNIKQLRSIRKHELQNKSDVLITQFRTGRKNMVIFTAIVILLFILFTTTLINVKV